MKNHNYKTNKIGDIVYAISWYYGDEGKKTDHCGIYKVRISEVGITIDKNIGTERIFYCVTDFDTKVPWDVEVNEEDISDNFDELIKTVRRVWEKKK